MTSSQACGLLDSSDDLSPNQRSGPALPSRTTGQALYDAAIESDHVGSLQAFGSCHLATALRPMGAYGGRFGTHRRYMVLTYHYAAFNHAATLIAKRAERSRRAARLRAATDVTPWHPLTIDPPTKGMPSFFRASLLIPKERAVCGEYVCGLLIGDFVARREK